MDSRFCACLAMQKTVARQNVMQSFKYKRGIVAYVWELTSGNTIIHIEA